jgi:hypothetical protein
MSCNADGHFRGKIEDDAAFDIALNQNERGDALAAIGVLVHRQIDNLCRSLQGLRKNRIGRIDERLNEFHSHERCSPASSTDTPAALGSSPKT